MQGIRLGMVLAAVAFCFYTTACSKKAEETTNAEIPVQEELLQNSEDTPSTDEVAPETATDESADSETTEN